MGAALGAPEGKPPKASTGRTLWVAKARTDVLFGELRGAAPDGELFHWETDPRQTTSQPAVRRYLL